MWSHFGPFWSVKNLNFWQKLPISTAHHTFLESTHPDVTKNPHYVLFLRVAKKRYQLMGYCKSIILLEIKLLRMIGFLKSSKDSCQPSGKMCIGNFLFVVPNF